MTTEKGRLQITLTIRDIEMLLEGTEISTEEVEIGIEYTECDYILVKEEYSDE